MLVNGLVFDVLFVAFTILLMLSDGYRETAAGFVKENYIYLNNLMEMWPLAAVMLIGVVMVLYAIGRSAICSGYRCGIWWSGIGTVLVVIVLLLIAGWNHTAYYPSLADPASSLSIANSSSSLFTLRVMSWVSIVIPFVIAYITVVWRKMNNKPITQSELDNESHQY